MLEEHYTDADEGSLPASALEAICPRRGFELEVIGASGFLQMRVPLAIGLLLECHLSTDLAPLLEDAGIAGW